MAQRMPGAVEIRGAHIPMPMDPMPLWRWSVSFWTGAGRQEAHEAAAGSVNREDAGRFPSTDFRLAGVSCLALPLQISGLQVPFRLVGIGNRSRIGSRRPCLFLARYLQELTVGFLSLGDHCHAFHVDALARDFQRVPALHRAHQQQQALIGGHALPEDLQ